MKNYFQASKENPFHVSIGAVVLNEKKQICCHYFENFSHPKIGGPFKDFYILMRETIEPNETIENCLIRGLMEEFGAKSELNSFLGSIVSTFLQDDIKIEKTTLYFLCNLVSIDINKRKKGDPESTSQIIWVNKDDLIRKMKDQKKRFGRNDVDESAILERI